MGVFKHWASVSKSMLSLLSCITNGFSWYDAALALQCVRGDLIFILLSFVIFCLFAVLNVMTGVFCQSAMETAQNTEDFRMATIMQTQSHMFVQVRKLFEEIDEDGSGLLTWKELQESWSD